MSDLISRSALLKAIEGVAVSFYLDDGVCGDNYDDTTIIDIINKQPTIEAVEVVHGEWIPIQRKYHCGVIFQCSICKSTQKIVPFNYCFNCGADMQKGGAK